MKKKQNNYLIKILGIFVIGIFFVGFGIFNISNEENYIDNNNFYEFSENEFEYLEENIIVNNYIDNFDVDSKLKSSNVYFEVGIKLKSGNSYFEVN